MRVFSAIGRVDYCRVRLVDGGVEPIALSGASILSSTTRADGFVIVPADSEGYGPETEVTVATLARTAQEQAERQLGDSEHRVATPAAVPVGGGR